jgi:hypothetical protein
MIFHPTIMALFVGSVLIGIMVLYAAFHAIQILLHWDLDSGSELQLTLERKTYLISTLLSYIFAFEILSFFLFIFTAEQLHVYFVGAMCAAGSLYVNSFGYPTLVVKLLNFLFAGIWLIVNYVDNCGYNYPLIKKKYAFFLFLLPLFLAETFLQANYFLRLHPNIITSCCGTLFSTDSYLLPSGIGCLSNAPMKTIFYATTLLAILTGIFYFVKGRGGYLFSAMSAAALVVSVASIFSFISSYVYELPTHHCPFCMLQKEYGYIGYPLYASLLGAAIMGISVGVLMPFTGIRSLSDRLPSILKQLTLVSVALFAIFTVIVTVRMLVSGLIMEGY